MPKREAKRKGSASHAVGARLRAFREEKRDISQETAAAAFKLRTGRSVLATYRRWEITGKITAPELLIAADILGCDACWVLTGVGNPAAGGRLDEEIIARIHDRVEELLANIPAMEAEMDELSDEGQDPPDTEAEQLPA